MVASVPSILPMEIMDKIVLLTRDVHVADALKDVISQYAFDQLEKRVLIFGSVQGGKTNEIIKYIKNCNKNDTIVLVVQNSLLVLNQYEQKFKKENLKCQIVDSTTTVQKENVLIVMNNKYRYNYLQKILPEKYILMLDESDQTIKSCPLQSYKTIHITATPYLSGLQYDRIIHVEKSPNYQGIEDITLKSNDCTFSGVESFLKTSSGIMLINKYLYEIEMQRCAANLSKLHPTVPIVLLMSNKKLFLNGKVKFLRNTSINKIIDNLSSHKHIIFIANRLSNRGLSYVSSDYKRHLTHQITKVKAKTTNFLQSLRILGIYQNKPKLTLVINKKDKQRFQKHLEFVTSFDPDTLLIK